MRVVFAPVRRPYKSLIKAPRVVIVGEAPVVGDLPQALPPQTTPPQADHLPLRGADRPAQRRRHLP